MNLIEFYAMKIKPMQMRGGGGVHPQPSTWITEELACMRQYDVNLCFFRRSTNLIAFDSGYRNYPHFQREMDKLGLNAEDVQAVFLTHADLDHAGGVSDGARAAFPKARVYLHEAEEPLLNGKLRRFHFGPFALSNPIRRRAGYTLLKSDEVVQLGDIAVQAAFCPGHTPGHCCYWLDEQILIAGDCLALNSQGGYAFFDFVNMDSARNRQSLRNLKTRFEATPPRFLCTGHNGYTQEPETYFAHIEETAFGTRKKPFDPTAPYDAFAEK